MNNFQNGSFSGLLHKLTKYQSLAATASNSAKHSLYSRKVQEYKSKLDQMNNTQTQRGGVFKMSMQNEIKMQEITQKINGLVPKEFAEQYKLLAASHRNIVSKLKEVHDATKLSAANLAAAHKEEITKLEEAVQRNTGAAKTAAQEALDIALKLAAGSAANQRIKDARAVRDGLAAASQKRREAAAAALNAAKKAASDASLATQAERDAAASALRDAQQALAKAEAELQNQLDAANIKARQDDELFRQAEEENKRLEEIQRKKEQELANLDASFNAFRNSKLQRISELETELISTRAELERIKKDTTGSDECNAEINDILQTIETSINTQNNINIDPSLTVSSLTKEAQAALQLLQSPAAAAAESVA